MSLTKTLVLGMGVLSFFAAIPVSASKPNVVATCAVSLLDSKLAISNSKFKSVKFDANGLSSEGGSLELQSSMGETQRIRLTLFGEGGQSLVEVARHGDDFAIQVTWLEYASPLPSRPTKIKQRLVLRAFYCAGLLVFDVATNDSQRLGRQAEVVGLALLAVEQAVQRGVAWSDIALKLKPARG